MTKEIIPSIKNPRKETGHGSTPSTPSFVEHSTDQAAVDAANQAALVAELQGIFGAVDDLELSVDNIDIDLDATNTLITATNAAIAALEAANDISGDDTVTAIEAAETSLNAALATLQASTETHSDEEQAAIASLEAAVAAFHAAFDARDLATETTLADLLASTGDETDVEATADGSVIAILKRIRTRLDQSITDFNAEDFASETTLAAFKAANNADILALKAANDASGDDIVTAIEALEAASDTSGDDIVTAINDCCTTLEASLTAIEADIEAFKAEAHADSLDTQSAVDELKTQNGTKHDSIITELQDVEADIEALIAQHLSESNDTQSRIGEVSATPTANTLLGRLKDIYESVDGLELSVDNIDIDMEVIGEVDDLEATGDGTLIAITKRLRTLTQAISDFLAAEDFAQEATQAAFKAEAHADSLDEQAAIDELKAQNLTQHGLIIGELQDIEADVEAFKAAFDARDLATETTLAAQPTQAQQTADLQAIEDAVDELKASNETHSDELKTELQQIEGDIEAFAAQNSTDLQSVEDAVDELKAQVISEDFATETTLATHPTQAQQTSDLQDIEDAVDELKTSVRFRASQILKHEGIKDTDDLFTKEIVSGLTTTFFVAVAPQGTATSAALWEVVRRKEVVSGATTDSMVEYRSGMAYDNYADPTIDGATAWRTDI